MIKKQMKLVNWLCTLRMPTSISRFILPRRVPLLLLLPRRVVVAVVATATPFLRGAVVAEPLSCFSIPSFVSFSPILCVLFWMEAMNAAWTSLSRDTASCEHLVGLSRMRQLHGYSFFFSLALSSLWTSRGHRCRPFSPPVLAFNFYRA